MDHHDIIGQMMVEEGSIIPTPTWSWNHSGNPNSIPSGNNGVPDFAVLANDSGGNPNEAYYLNPALNANIAYNSVNHGADVFTMYQQFIKHSDGDANCDILSNHASGEGWTTERTSGSNYIFVGWDEENGIFLTNNFNIPNGSLVQMFTYRIGSDIFVDINGSQVATVAGVGTIVDHNGGMLLGALPSSPTTHNADITVDGHRIWKQITLTAEERAAQRAEGI